MSKWMSRNTTLELEPKKEKDVPLDKVQTNYAAVHRQKEHTKWPNKWVSTWLEPLLQDQSQYFSGSNISGEDDSAPGTQSIEPHE